MSKITIITGGTSGIGRGIAEKILENSALDDILYVSYGHNTEQAEEFLHAQTEENQKKIRLLQADMSSYDEICIPGQRRSEPCRLADKQRRNQHLCEI